MNRAEISEIGLCGCLGVPECAGGDAGQSLSRIAVYRRGEVSSAGFLRGDLILVASGDLTMGGRTMADGTMAFVDGDHTYANSGLTASELTKTNPLAGMESLARQIAANAVTFAAPAQSSEYSSPRRLGLKDFVAIDANPICHKDFVPRLGLRM